MKLVVRFHLLFVLWYMLLTSGKHQVAHSGLTGSHHALSIQCNVHFFAVGKNRSAVPSLFIFSNSELSPFATTFQVLASLL